MPPDKNGTATESSKLLSKRGMKLRIALTSAFVLAAGAWLAPHKQAADPPPAEQVAAPILEERVTRRDPLRAFGELRDLTARVRSDIIAVLPPEMTTALSHNDFAQPERQDAAAGFGVVLSPMQALTHAGALDGRVEVPVRASDGSEMTATVAAYDPVSGLVLLQLPRAPSGAGIVLAAEAPSSGALAVAVGQWDGRTIASPVFITSVQSGEYALGAIGAGALAGMPIVNLDGELIAMVGDGARQALAVRETAATLQARAAAGERRASLGIAFQDLGGPLTSVFGSGGALISEVVPGGPADVAGIEAGDVARTVNGTAIDDATSVHRAVETLRVGVPALFTVRRAGKERSLEIHPRLAYEVAALARTAAQRRQLGVEARVLLNAAVLDQARLPPTAELLAINGRPVTTRAQADLELRRRRSPSWFLVRHGGQQFFVAIELTK